MAYGAWPMAYGKDSQLLPMRSCPIDDAMMPCLNLSAYCYNILTFSRMKRSYSTILPIAHPNTGQNILLPSPKRGEGVGVGFHTLMGSTGFEPVALCL